MIPAKIFYTLCTLIGLLPLLRITQEPVNRQVFGLYSVSYFGLILLWWVGCGVVIWIGSVRDSGKRRVLVFKTILALFSILVSLFILELFFHIRPGYVPMEVRARLAAGGAFLDFQGQSHTEMVPGLRYSLAANQLDLITVESGNLMSSIKPVSRAAASGLQVFERRTDHQGFCNPASITGKVSCLFIGDSFTDISCLPWEKRWTVELSSKMGWSMRNLSIGGIGPPEAVRILETLGAPHEPDLVVFSIYEGNDPWDADCWLAWQASGMSYTRFLVKKETFQNRIILFKWYEHLISRLAVWRPGKSVATAPEMTFSGPFADRLTLSESDLQAFAGWQATMKSVADAKGWCEQHGARLVVLLWPSKEHVYALRYASQGDERMTSRLTGVKDPAQAKEKLAMMVKNADTIHALLARTCAEAKIPFCFVMPAFQAMLQKGETPYYFDDIHPNSAGSKAATEYLAGQESIFAFRQVIK